MSNKRLVKIYLMAFCVSLPLDTGAILIAISKQKDLWSAIPMVIIIELLHIVFILLLASNYKKVTTMQDKGFTNGDIVLLVLSDFTIESNWEESIILKKEEPFCRLQFSRKWWDEKYDGEYRDELVGLKIHDLVLRERGISEIKVSK